MITLLIGTLSAAEWQEILGLILTGLEVLLVLVAFLQILVDPESKFGKFLKKLLKGITFVKGKIEESKNKDKEDKTKK
jgi:hypothetical protein